LHLNLLAIKELQMVMDSREKYLGDVRSMVIKLGTQLLADRTGKLDTAFIANIAAQVTALRKSGKAVSIVSSGAIAAGMGELKLSDRPTDLPHLQAVAAVGQRKLMDAWAAAFSQHKISVAQILLTREDIDHRGRFLNLRNTVSAIQELGSIAIINENDSVSTDELIKITFGDNDLLAAAVTHALHADLLVLLTGVDGILDETGKSVRTVSDIAQAQSLVRKEKSTLGKGGMNSKLQAARLVTDAGATLIVAEGKMPGVLERIMSGVEVGTLFLPAERKWSSRSRWIGSARALGKIHVDQGCAGALVERHKSLLPAGIVSIEGEFAPGDIVAIVDPQGKVLGKGLTNYAAADVRQIAGKRTAEVHRILAEAAYDEVVHCNNFVLSSET
jgi:glutamate 5-kinase